MVRIVVIDGLIKLKVEAWTPQVLNHNDENQSDRAAKDDLHSQPSFPSALTPHRRPTAAIGCNCPGRPDGRQLRVGLDDAL
jgi:hypothetical protein